MVFTEIFSQSRISTNQIGIYHSNLINLNKHEADGSVNNIINGTNVTHITRECTIASQSDAADALAAVTSNENVELKPSYINAKSVITGNDLGIQPYLINAVNGTYPGAKINQEIEIEFFDIQSEFPERTADQTDIGVNVLVYSNLSYVEASLPYSNKKSNYRDNQYFYIEDTNSATLRLKADDDIQYDLFDIWGNSSFNESQLGINGYSRTNTYNWKTPYQGMPVSATAIYNTAGISNFSDAKQVKYILQLYKKTDVSENGAISVVKYERVDIDDYISNVKLTGGSVLTKDENQSDALEYVYIEDIYDTADPPEIIANMSDQIFTAKLDFEVKTGGDFKDYANYQVLLIAELLDTNGNVISNSLKRDFIVYTNAKIHPEFLIPTTTP